MNRRTLLATLGTGLASGCSAVRSKRHESTTATTEITTEQRSTATTQQSAIQKSTGTVEDGDFSTITVPANERRLIPVSDGETFQNVLIDMSAPGASAKIHPTGSDWTIRNVGFRGVHPGGNYLLTPAATEGSRCTVENVYMGDGQVEKSPHGGIWVRSDHEGIIDFRGINVQQFVDNGLYGTNSAGDNGGIVNVYDSYFRSNNDANVRLGTADGTCVVKNTVSIGDRQTPVSNHHEPSDREYGTQCRGIWAWWGDVVVENCDIDVEPEVGTNLVESQKNEQAARARIRTRNTRVGAAARHGLPDAVPPTPFDAATGR